MTNLFKQTYSCMADFDLITQLMTYLVTFKFSSNFYY